MTGSYTYNQLITPTHTDQLITPTHTNQLITPTHANQLITPTNTDQLITPTHTNQLITPTNTDQLITDQLFFFPQYLMSRRASWKFPRTFPTTWEAPKLPEIISFIIQ